MATQSPFSMLESIFENVTLPEPPPWLLDESHRRLVLLLNHVLMQEPQAMERLVRQKGRVILCQRRQFTLRLSITPAGLLDLASGAATPDLTLAVTEESPLALLQSVMQGVKPAVHIQGDVQLAAEVNWLADHLRWDIEEDLARIVGDAPAHMMAQAVRSAVAAMQQFVGRKSSDTPAGSAA